MEESEQRSKREITKASCAYHTVIDRVILKSIKNSVESGDKEFWKNNEASVFFISSNNLFFLCQTFYP